MDIISQLDMVKRNVLEAISLLDRKEVRTKYPALIFQQLVNVPDIVESARQHIKESATRSDNTQSAAPKLAQIAAEIEQEIANNKPYRFAGVDSRLLDKWARQLRAL